MSKGKHHAPGFKAKVALEALKGEGWRDRRASGSA
jgi:predicted RNA binding protein YcfA (HicA-like mRNA interferase family)